MNRDDKLPVPAHVLVPPEALRKDAFVVKFKGLGFRV